MFAEDMLRDAKLLDDHGLVWSLQSSLEAVKGAVGTVNERKRNWERRERVSLVADRLVDVPPGVEIRRRDREFVFDQDNFLQKDRPGYRKLVLFTDAVLVCEQVPCGFGSVNFIEAALSPSPSRSSATLSWGGRRGCTPKKDLRFKDLISLHRLELSDCPCVLEPSASSMSLDASVSPPKSARARPSEKKSVADGVVHKVCRHLTLHGPPHSAGCEQSGAELLVCAEGPRVSRHKGGC